MKQTTSQRLRAAGLLGLFLTASGACGKRGNPLPPLRPLPARVADATARRVADRVELRFTIPATNSDNSTPPAVTRVEIYAAVGPASTGAWPSIPIAVLVPAISTSKPIVVTRFPPLPWTVLAPSPTGNRRGLGPPMTAAQLLRPEYLRGHIDVKPPPPPPEPDSTAGTKPVAPAPAAAASAPAPDDRPTAGQVTTFIEDVTKERAATTPDASVLRYIVVPVAGRARFGAPSVVMEVPLRLAIAPPATAVVTYDEHTLKMAWTAATPAERFRVYRSDRTGKEQPPSLSAAPLAASEFAVPVEFGVEQCFIVRSVLAIGPTSVESEGTRPACVTAVDTFPPAAPTRLFEQPFEGKISLSWSAVDALDLAGYLVLRAEGDDQTMRPLMTSPITETAFVDTTTKIGARYVYTVVAVDQAGNRSAESNRVTEIGR